MIEREKKKKNQILPVDIILLSGQAKKFCIFFFTNQLEKINLRGGGCVDLNNQNNLFLK